MTPIIEILARFLPAKLVPIALVGVYSFLLFGIFFFFEIRSDGIPYADQRDTSIWRTDP